MVINDGEVLTITELAAYLKIPKSTLYKLVREGRIPSQKIGRHWRFRKGAIDLWLDETQVNKPAPNIARQDPRPWEVNPEKISAAVRKIIEVSRPLKLILFGSYIRGEANIDSDLDVVVITPDNIENPRKESVRIRRALRGISMPMDILVVPYSKWEELKNLPGLIYREASMKGKVVYES